MEPTRRVCMKEFLFSQRVQKTENFLKMSNGSVIPHHRPLVLAITPLATRGVIVETTSSGHVVCVDRPVRATREPKLSHRDIQFRQDGLVDAALNLYSEVIIRCRFHLYKKKTRHGGYLFRGLPSPCRVVVAAQAEGLTRGLVIVPQFGAGQRASSFLCLSIIRLAYVVW